MRNCVTNGPLSRMIKDVTIPNVSTAIFVNRLTGTGQCHDPISLNVCLSLIM
jgi:hypothetical protein